VLQEKGIEEGDFAKVLSEEVDLVVGGGRWELSESLEEAKHWGDMEVELEGAEDVELELEDLFFGEFVLWNIQKVLQFWWVDLFVLSCNKERGHTKDMELSLFDLDFWQITVNYGDRYVEGLRLEPELSVDINDPLYQETSWSISHLALDLA